MAFPRAERSSRISFTALSRLAGSAPHEYCIFVSGHGAILSVGGTLGRLVARPDSVLRGQPLSSLVRKPDGKPFGPAFLRPRSRSNPQRKNFALIGRDGRRLACRGMAYYFDALGADAGGVLVVGSRIRPAKNGDNDVLTPGDREKGLFASIQDGLCIVDASGTILSATARLAGLAGLHPADMVNVPPPYPWLGEEDNRRLAAALAGVVKTGEPAHLLVVLDREENPPLALSFLISRLDEAGGRFLASVRNITDVHPVQENQMAEKRIGRLKEQLQRNGVRLKTLQDVNHAILRSGSLPAIFRLITQGVRHLVDHDLAGIYVFDLGGKILRPHTLSKLTPFSRRLGKLPLTLGEGIVGASAITGETVLVNNAQQDPRSVYPPGLKPEIEHIIAVPLRGRESTHGILAVARNRHPGFHEEDALIIQSFADAASIAIDNIRLAAALRNLRGGDRAARPAVSPRRGTVAAGGGDNPDS